MNNEDELKITDLQEQHRKYAELIGIKNLLALSKNYGGQQIYIPQYEELIKIKKYRDIARDYNSGKTIKELVRKYKVSESLVYKLVRKEMSKGVVRNLPGQLSIFNCDNGLTL